MNKVHKHKKGNKKKRRDFWRKQEAMNCHIGRKCYSFSSKICEFESISELLVDLVAQMDLTRAQGCVSRCIDENAHRPLLIDTHPCAGAHAASSSLAMLCLDTAAVRALRALRSLDDVLAPVLDGSRGGSAVSPFGSGVALGSVAPSAGGPN